MEFLIKEQPSLSMSKCLDLVLNGVQFRMFRAGITVAIVALAIAFLMTIVGDSIIERQVRRDLSVRSAPRQNFLFWVNRVSDRMTPSDLSAILLTSVPKAPRWEEFKEWGNCRDADVARLKTVAQEEEVWLKFFAGLQEGQRRQVVGRLRDREIFLFLAEDAEFVKAAEKIKSLGVDVPKPLEELKSFVEEWQKTAEMRSIILEAHAGAVAAAGKAFEGRAWPKVFAELSSESALKLKKLGFRITDEELPALKVEAARSLDSERIVKLLDSPSFKMKVKMQLEIPDINKVSADGFMRYLSTKKGAKWLAGNEESKKTGLSADRIRSVCEEVLEQKKLDGIGAALADFGQGSGMFGFSTRVQWLIIVSLLVCAVGITNAMLMSVTERFREIATMKCLGATDGFIMINFLLESGLQGLAGGLIGGLLGAVLGLTRATAACGVMAFQNIPVFEMILSFILCIVVGIILSIVAAIYPARVAARLAPMEAMRVE